ncbi:hypothetical protein BJY00DRAFT_290963 [Aspergillus carlsbadensis]|nr:hypothetical protein BJY00DRAFT_290963 [Aspergillus carlsbadensis]
MGQASSQPTDGAHFVQNGEAPSEIITQPNGESRKNHEAARKRKRKSSNVNSQPKSPEATNQPSEKSQTIQERNSKLNGEHTDVESNMARPSINHSPPTMRKRLVDSLENKLPSEPNRSTKPKPSKLQNKPSGRRESQGPNSEPRTPKKALQKVASHRGSPSIPTSSLARGTPNKSNRNGTTGAFQPEEVEALEKFKVEFCNTNNCSLATFDQMVQHGMQGTFPGERWIGKRPFWKSAFEVLPDRDHRSVLRFMKRHFQGSDQKSHVWTEEQEAELVALIRQHGPKYALLADMLGRSSDDVVQRWKNRLEHRDKMKIGVWSEDELDALRSALTVAWTRSKGQGYDVGDNIYEMDESLISWGEVSKKMGHVRSRQQCADKWRRIKSKLSNSQPNSRSATPATSRRPSRGPSQFRSSRFVESDADDSDEQDDIADSQGKGSTSAHSPRKSPIKKKHTPRNEASSSESQSGSGSEADSGPKDDSEGDSSSTSESESEGEQTTAKKSKALSEPSSKGKSGSKPKDKTLSNKKPGAGSRSGSETRESNRDETTADESDDSSSKEGSDSTDENGINIENESDASSSKRTAKDAQYTIKRKAESPIHDDGMGNEKPAKIMKQGFSPTMSEDEEGGQQSDSDAESGPDFKVQKYEPSWFVSSKASY